ncbi:MAG TPA: hypothetical protein VK486_08320 [Thermoleophilaceae bacterium]|nr:hypothetical protein [Thermoleophilaceae bacterium]
MEDSERRLRQLLARHIQLRAEDAGREPLDGGSCHQAVALVRLWQAAGDDWDQPEAFGQFEHLMSDFALAPSVIPVSDEELLASARAVADAARALS